MGSRLSTQHAFQAMPRFTVGRDHHGWWVVQDSLDRVGGLFASQAAALHFAHEESNHDPHATQLAPEGSLVELEPMSPHLAQAPASNVTRFSRRFG